MYLKGEHRKMKKSKLSVGLVASFIGALALTSCGETPAVTSKTNSIVEFIGYNSETEQLEIKVDEIYSKYANSDDGTKLYYDAVLEALIRYEYPKLSAKTGSKLKKFSKLEEEADDKVQSSKETANTNASNNGTTYDEEWDKILESHDCENEAELKQYYLFDLEKTELNDRYFKDHEEELKTQYLGLDQNWATVESTNDVDAVYPYHILHILVSLGAAKDNYNSGTISKAEAQKLWDVVLKLIDATTNERGEKKYTFQKVAEEVSDDTGSKSKGGDVGIMSTRTSFYNEFKLGIYAYDAILSGVNSNTAETKAIYNAFGLSDDATIVTETTTQGETTAKVVETVKNEMAKNVSTPVSTGTVVLPTVPYSVFQKISDVAEEETYDDPKEGKIKPESGDVALPRNVLYNQFLNFHSPFLITNEDIAEIAGEDVKVSTTKHNFADETNELHMSATNFKAAEELGLVGLNGKEVLCDDQGNVIIGVRSESGIHFMVMRKSVFKGTNETVKYADGTKKSATSLLDYFTSKLPSETAGYETYVNMKANKENSYYTERAKEIQSDIESTSTFDAAYSYRLYEELLAEVEGTIHFSDEKDGHSEIKDNIQAYIDLLRENKHYSNIDSMNDAWESYLLMLRYQNDVRSKENSLLPTTCAFHFGGDEFKEGGKCYVKAK